jgi:hypothetical protein
MIRPLIAFIAGGLLLSVPSVAFAGMPSFHLSDAAEMRFQTISFFLVGFLVCAALIQLLWNWLRQDFTALPRLSYPKAVGVVTLWGLLFVLVLTMISGARELMTPGAWEKTGLTYKLAKQSSSTAEAVDDLQRFQRIDLLRVVLWNYARSHEGHFPSTSEVPEIPKERWLLPGPSGLTYRYIGGRMADQGKKILVFEPQFSGSGRWVLWTNGEIESVPEQELMRTLAGEQSP